MRALALIAFAILATPAAGQVSNPPVIPAAQQVDTSNLATKAEAQAAKTAADNAAASAAAADAKAIAAKAAADAAAAATVKTVNGVAPVSGDVSLPQVAAAQSAAAAADAKAVAAKTAADNAAATLVAVQAAMPLPSTSVPLPEQVTPAVGTSTRYRRMDDVQPRITRAKSCTLIAGGTCSVTYEALAATDPNVIAFAINAGTQPIICGPSAAATTTTATIKCFITQPTTLPALATSLLGLLIPVTVTAPAGTAVQVTILPKN